MIDISKGRYWDKGVELVSDGQIITHPDRLDVFRKTRKPTVFAIWNDFYHGAVDQRFRLDAARIMDCCDRHTFLILTKRADQAANYGKYIHGKNIWNGLTVCNQAEAEVKIPVFLQVPGKRFLSIEPMLGPIDISWPLDHPERTAVSQLDAVILGGETGPGARPLNPDWVRSVRDQCAASNTPFFFKSWGAWKGSKDFVGDKSVPGSERIGRLLDGRSHDELPWVKV